MDKHVTLCTKVQCYKDALTQAMGVDESSPQLSQYGRWLSTHVSAMIDVALETVGDENGVAKAALDIFQRSVVSMSMGEIERGLHEWPLSESLKRVGIHVRSADIETQAVQVNAVVAPTRTRMIKSAALLSDIKSLAVRVVTQYRTAQLVGDTAGGSMVSILTLDQLHTKVSECKSYDDQQQHSNDLRTICEKMQALVGSPFITKLKNEYSEVSGKLPTSSQYLDVLKLQVQKSIKETFFSKKTVLAVVQMQSLATIYNDVKIMKFIGLGDTEFVNVWTRVTTCYTQCKEFEYYAEAANVVINRFPTCANRVRTFQECASKAAR